MCECFKRTTSVVLPEKVIHASLCCVADRLRNRLKEYSLITPFSTDSHGHYLSHLLSATHKQRVKRDAFPSAESDQKLFFNISVFGKEFHLRLRPNSGLVAPGAMVEWHDEVDANATVTAADPGEGLSQTRPPAGTERILHRELLKTDCTFIGDITDVPRASVAINNCDGLVSLPPTHSFILLEFFVKKSVTTLSTDNRFKMARTPKFALPLCHRSLFLVLYDALYKRGDILMVGRWDCFCTELCHG